MKKLLPLLSLPVILFSCGSEEIKLKKKEEPTKALIIGDPLDCGLDSLMLFPVGASYEPEIFEAPVEESEVASGNVSVTLAENNASTNVSFTANYAVTDVLYDRGADMEYRNDQVDDFDIRNLLFYNMTTGETYPLMLDSLHILSFALHREYHEGLIFYRVVKEDYNKDGKYNSLDPVMLYTSDLIGGDFQQITPENEHFIDYTYYKKDQKIMIKTILDSDKNKAFASNDETNFREMELANPKAAKEIFSKALKDSLRVYY